MIKIHYVSLLVGLMFLYGCSNPDYRPTIKEIMKPLQSELSNFYKKHQRYPTHIERDQLLENSGCTVKGDVCYYKGYKFKIESYVSYDYSVILKLKNSDCLTGLFKDGDIKVISCQYRGTTDLGQ